MSDRVCPVTANLALTQSLEKLLFAIEFRYFYVSVTYFIQGMGITAGALVNAMFSGKVQSFSRTAEEGTPGIKDFHNINLFRQVFYYLDF